jgi:methylmalonyl-CoA/ethylmalonyl-CoA epimerase
MTVNTRFSKKLLHVGVVVRDLDKTVKRLESLGIGPFKPLPLPPLEGGKPLFRGKPIDPEEYHKLLIADIGGVGLEIIEPVKGASPYQEFLDTKGEGIHHLTFAVDDLDREVAKFTERGVNVILKGRFQESGGGDYLDLEVGGIILCLFQA